MSHLKRESIQKLTELCSIRCTEEEKEALLQDLEKTLSYVDKLQEVDTENVPPCNNVLATVSNVMREDVIGETLSRETFLSNAPNHCNGMICVPPVITKSNQTAQEGGQ